MSRVRTSSIVLIAVLAAGCGGSGEDDAASTSPAGSPETTAVAGGGLGPSSAAFPEDNCGMIPVADISEAAGLEFTIEEEDPFGVPGCRYAAPDGGVLYLTYRSDDFEYHLAQQEADESATIDGIGAGAFEFFPPNARAVEVLLDDGRSFEVQAGAGADDPDGLQRIAAVVADILPGLHG